MKRLILFLMVLLVFAGCAKSFESGMRHSINSEAKKYLGVKYEYGGTTPSGFDCSGFVQYVYARCGIALPRTAGDIAAVMRKTNNPLTGDIVLFKDPAHIGIYIGKGNFIHASSSRGVTVDNLSEQWFKQRFTGFFTYF